MPLPVHGFVLAGGKSTRMGRDKALLPFRGRPMAEIAVEKLRGFCAEVSIAGSREDLAVYAPVVPDDSVHIGPAGGMEASLSQLRERWAFFLPVDAPLVPRPLLQSWCEQVLVAEARGVRLSFLQAAGIRQPAFAMVHSHAGEAFRRVVAEGVYKLGRVYELLAVELGSQAVWMAQAENFGTSAGIRESDVQHMFSNLNTPEELSAAESWAQRDGANLQGADGEAHAGS